MRKKSFVKYICQSTLPRSRPLSATPEETAAFEDIEYFDVELEIGVRWNRRTGSSLAVGDVRGALQNGALTDAHVRNSYIADKPINAIEDVNMLVSEIPFGIRN